MNAENRRLNRRAKTVAFKADEELAEFLRLLPNASDFIRKGVLAQFRMNCPLCVGTGVVARGVGEHYVEQNARFRFRACEACGAVEPIPADPDTAPEPVRPPVRAVLPRRAVLLHRLPRPGIGVRRLPADLLTDYRLCCHRG